MVVSPFAHERTQRHRSMLRAVGFTDADFKKPIVGIASTWSMVTPCNMHIDKLARRGGRRGQGGRQGAHL
jgi:dihydroxy-acid dehydratase